MPRHDRDCLEQGLMAVGEMPGRRQRSCAVEQKLHTLFHRRGLREQPQSGAEPPSGALGSEARR
jgi:hypothetical protein